jgi:hypothetical protein
MGETFYIPAIRFGSGPVQQTHKETALGNWPRHWQKNWTDNCFFTKNFPPAITIQLGIVEGRWRGVTRHSVESKTADISTLWALGKWTTVGGDLKRTGPHRLIVFECLVMKGWYYLRGIRRHGLVGVGVALLEEVFHWGWGGGLWGFKTSSHTKGLLPADLYVEFSASPAWMLPCSPAMMTMDWTSETVSKSQLNAFPYKSCLGSWAVMAHIFNPRTWEAEAEAGGFLILRPAWSTEWVPGQPGLHRETLSRKTNKQKQTNKQTNKQKRVTLVIVSLHSDRKLIKTRAYTCIHLLNQLVLSIISVTCGQV